MNIAFIPIDDRPVCYSLPEQIGSLAKENNIFLPDKNLLGNLRKKADYKSIIKWLDGLKNIDSVIVSLDTIAYGGLIPSRRTNESYETVISRIDLLSDVLERKKAEVYAFSSIMRISNNNINEEEKEYWSEYGEKIFKYSYDLHKKESLNSDEEIECDIPDEILKDYLDTRKRNFEVNKYYLSKALEGKFKMLVFAKDDCSRYGLNVKEAQELRNLAGNNKNIIIKTGADEIPITLLSKAINKKKYIRIAPVYTNPESIKKISKYEDISVEESVNSQIELSGGILSDIENCDLILYVNNFKTEQGELVMNVDTELFEGEIKIPDKPYFIADIVNANGSDNNFMEKLLNIKNYKEFYGYSAWNTTGNTLGSAISAAMIYFGAKRPNTKGFHLLQFIRFLDDWAYQANVRAKIRNDKANLNNNMINTEMKNFEDILIKKFKFKFINIEYLFPWNRFFEIGIKIKYTYTKLPFVDILFYE